MVQVENSNGAAALAPEMAYSEALPAQGALTVEIALYGVIALVGVLLRFVLLGNAPLAPFEAANSWSAWLAATATPVADVPAVQSALLYGLQSLLFFVAGGSDWLARLAPALAGVAVVLLPWFWRSWLGRVPALALALLFAVDPWLVAFSRTADGVSLTIFLALLTMVAFWQRHEAAEGRCSVALGAHSRRECGFIANQRRSSLELCASLGGVLLVGGAPSVTRAAWACSARRFSGLGVHSSWGRLALGCDRKPWVR